ncbi:type II secretion system F family protein [Nocardioides mangrovicus]|uniref:type II secretion system F family protein n=1 Tax=Nocardioides mangrovicus TaxID=2478913 RepID=UPI001313F1B5|nr:type II secretion system F family protein [Nocardioides mangrovicus]
MSPAAWAAAGAALVAVRLALGPTPQVTPRPDSARQVSDLDVRRLLLTLTAGAGSSLLVPGVAGGVAAVVVAAVAWRLLGRLPPAAEIRRRERLASELPGAVDLLACALRAGSDAAGALGLVAEALPGPVAEELRGVLLRLRLGADVGAVWADVARHPQLGPLGRALARAHRSGASVALAADRLAEELREVHRGRVEARARSVSTKAAAPLGLCFLPAFVLLGIVPLVAGLVATVR